MLLRLATISDTSAIRTLIAAAFRDAPHAGGTEADIVDLLRADDALTISIVASDADDIVGHVAFSAVTIGGRTMGWFGLGPVAVRREMRRKGLGARLIEAGLDNLRKRNAGGCVVLGDPAYYGRFGFVTNPRLFFADAPAAYFQSLLLQGDDPVGEVKYHAAFS